MVITHLSESLEINAWGWNETGNDFMIVHNFCIFDFIIAHWSLFRFWFLHLGSVGKAKAKRARDNQYADFAHICLLCQYYVCHASYVWVSHWPKSYSGNSDSLVFGGFCLVEINKLIDCYWFHVDFLPANRHNRHTIESKRRERERERETFYLLLFTSFRYQIGLIDLPNCIYFGFDFSLFFCSSVFVLCV